MNKRVHDEIVTTWIGIVPNTGIGAFYVVNILMLEMEMKWMMFILVADTMHALSTTFCEPSATIVTLEWVNTLKRFKWKKNAPTQPDTWGWKLRAFDWKHRSNLGIWWKEQWKEKCQGCYTICAKNKINLNFEKACISTILLMFSVSHLNKDSYTYAN